MSDQPSSPKVKDNIGYARLETAFLNVRGVKLSRQDVEDVMMTILMVQPLTSEESIIMSELRSLKTDQQKIDELKRQVAALQRERDELFADHQHWVRAFARMAMDYSNGSSRGAAQIVDMYRERTAAPNEEAPGH